MKTLSLIAMMALALSAQAADQPEKISCAQTATKHIKIKQAEYEARPGVSFQIESFVATMVPMSKEMPACLRNETFIQSGSITIGSAALSTMFNEKRPADSKVKDLKITNSGQDLKITGTVHKLIPIHFEITGPAKPAKHGDVYMPADSIHANGLPVKGLLKMLGKDLASLMSSSSARGISAEQNTIVFHTEQLMNFRGEITAVRMVGDGVRLEFGSNKQVAQEEPAKGPVKTAKVVPARK